jgi:Glycosyl transferase family 2
LNTHNVIRDPVDVILLTYNRVDYLQQMIDAIERHTQWPYRLTIVDNASGAQTREWLRGNRSRFHQIIWNSRNEHLAGHQRGIEATDSDLFVLSDADLIPHAPTVDGCWLTRLVALSERHPDFGLIGTRLDSITDARNSHLQQAPILDGEIIEAATGVWLNLMRRNALRIPYMSDGITCYALRRAGYRVGIAANVYSTHLGDQDPLLHPAYLAGKQSASGIGTVYPSYPELQQAGRPPQLQELALAAPVLAVLSERGVEPADTVELSRRLFPPLGAVEARIESCVKGRRTAAARWSYHASSPLAPGGAVAVAVLCADKHDDGLLADAFAGAGEWVVLLTDDLSPQPAADWELECELPGPNPVIHRLAKIAGRTRWRRAIGYTTSENHDRWLAMMAASAFGTNTPLRLYVFRRHPSRPAPPSRWCDPATGEPLGEHGDGEEIVRPAAPRWRVPQQRANRLGASLTKLSRLVRAEWYLHRT